MPVRAGAPSRNATGLAPKRSLVVNEAFVERFFPGRNPVGRTLTMTLEVPDGKFTFDPRRSSASSATPCTSPS